MLLKIIAWEDRPEIRRDDIVDICDVLNYYFEMHSDEIYEEHSDIFADENAETATLIELSARVMGREIKGIAQRNGKLLARISKILEANTADPATSKMAEIMVQYFNNTIEESMRLLQYLKVGFDE